MKLNFIILLAVCFKQVLCVSSRIEPSVFRQKRLINGEPGNSKEFPYIVSLQGRKENSLQALLFGSRETYCGGTWIAPQWVVTAAHCLYSELRNGMNIAFTKPKYWHIRIQREKLKPNVVEKITNVWARFTNKIFGKNKKLEFYHVSRIIKHPDYVPGVLENDIALFKIKETMDMSNFPGNPFLPLPSSKFIEKFPRTIDECIVAGWGCGRANGPPQMDLKKMKMPILHGDRCRYIFDAPINLTDSKEFCAGFQNKNKGICPGDSGGPLACYFNGRYELAGIVSAAHSKQPENFPSIYTRASYFKDWITKTMKYY